MNQFPGIRSLLLVTILAALPTSFARAQCEVQVLDAPSAFHGISIDFWEDTLVYSRALGPDIPVDVAIAERDGFDLPVVATVGPEPFECQTIYGNKVAIEGDWLAVGDPFTGCPETVCIAGKVYMYRREGRAWELFQAIPSPTFQQVAGPGPDGHAKFGKQMVFQDDLLVVGVPDSNIDDVGQVGIVFLYRFNGTEWVQEGYILNPEPVQSGKFGFSVAIDGDVLVVGATGNNGFAMGTTYIYRHVEEEWTLEAQFLAPIQDFQTSFGRSVDIVGDMIVVGAPRNQFGRAYVFRYDGDEWFLDQTITTPNVDGGPFSVEFGGNVKLTPDGQTLVIGARGDHANGISSGSAFVFREIDGEWVETMKLVPDASTDFFGDEVAVSDDFAAISASFSGQMFIYAGLSGTDCNGNDIADACDIFHGDSLDLNQNGIPDECETPGSPADLNDDGVVGIADLLILLGAWGPCADPDNCPADLNGDGAVGVADLLILLAAWG